MVLLCEDFVALQTHSAFSLSSSIPAEILSTESGPFFSISANCVVLNLSIGTRITPKHRVEPHGTYPSLSKSFPKFVNFEIKPASKNVSIMYFLDADSISACILANSGWCEIANLWAHSKHSDLGAAEPFGDGSSIVQPVPQANSEIYN